jgi:hypothetical protein
MMNEGNKYQYEYNNKRFNNVYFDMNGKPSGFYNPNNTNELFK